jgi:ATP-binding cassette subfamily B protein RaxB
MLFAFVAYRDQFSLRLSGLIDKAFEIKALRVHGDRVADIVFSDKEAQPEQPGSERDLGDLSASIELRNVSFQYSSNDPMVLKDVNLMIGEGECVAITGPSGSGKTTLIKIILGLIAPTQGEVLIGGVPLMEAGLHNYRRAVATVMQDDHLFSGTIGENVTFFAPEPDDEFVTECATIAAIHDEIARMPMRYNTIVGNIGTSLSGGQRQRLLLARALYRRPKILVLDEATSHLDLRNEKLINLAIKGMRLTRVIVAHRPETVAMADRTIAVKDGTVICSAGQHAAPPLPEQSLDAA